MVCPLPSTFSRVMLAAIVNVSPGANPGQDRLIKLRTSALTTEVSDKEISFTGDTYLIYKAWGGGR